MGSEITNKKFTKEDFKAFDSALLRECDYIKTLFDQGSTIFSNQYRIGYELEACILTQTNEPNPLNEEILEDLHTPFFTNELAKYDLEINGSVFDIDHNAPNALDEDLTLHWKQAQASASKFGANLGLFGVLPSLELKHFNKELYQSQMHRYTVVSQRIRELRHESVKINFHGEDEVALQKDDVMLEALGTSLQVHFQIPFDKAVDYYHAALLASVVLVGFGANSPLVMGKRAWHESRIPIFEQSVDTRDKQRRANHDETRVHFAHGYIHSWLDLFDQNNKLFKIIFADVQERSVEDLHHFNLHNGTIWRWVRPIIGKDSDGKHTLRLELRVLPSGPTLIDTQVNIWFFIGLIEGLVRSGINLTKLPFETLKNDFYDVAKYGLTSTFHEPIDGKKVQLNEWIAQEGVSLVQQGLTHFNITNINQYLSIIKARSTTTQNGANWQCKHFKKYRSIPKLMEDYMQNFSSNIPVHEWNL
jgi:gamma-glutamyl:cysteine ligase YbdK (ATP-grasp superfamily)